jgi:hypothetical protein
MWLNMIFLSLASLFVGFLLGWLVGRPRRWGVFAAGGPVGDGGPQDQEQLTGGARPSV